MSKDYLWLKEQADSFWEYPVKGLTFKKESWIGDDHDHCLFCWKKISDYALNGEVEKQGFHSTDRSWWACPDCFEEFKKYYDVPLLKNTVKMIEDALINDKKVIISLRNDQYFIERKAGKICVCRKDEIVEYNSIEEMEAKQPFYGKCIGEIIDEIYIGIC